LKPGFVADVVVFDPAAMRDTATFAEPHRYAEGMRDVLVNGVPVLKDGEHTDARGCPSTPSPTPDPSWGANIESGKRHAACQSKDRRAVHAL